MMAGPQPFVAGPTPIYVDGDLLGTAERYPRYLIRSGWLPYFNDVSGPIIPMDMLWAGKEAFIFFDLNRWDEDVLENFRTITNEAPDSMSWLKTDVGTLMIHEEASVPIKILFPYAAKFKYSSMPGGYNFRAGWYEGPEEFNVNGTTPRKVHIVAHCLAVDDGDFWTLADILDSNGNVQ